MPPADPPTAKAGRVPVTDYGGHLRPFYHDGKTYLFGLAHPDWLDPVANAKALDNAAFWWVVDDDPRSGLRPAVRRARMSSRYAAVVPFYLNNHPYIFGLHSGSGDFGHGSVGANIWRINDDPSTGFTLVMYGHKMSVDYPHVLSFQLDGQPYILGLHKDVGANIWRVKETPDGVTMQLVKYGATMSPNYRHLEVFYLDGHPYIFGAHLTTYASGANIWRVKDDPAQGLDLVTEGAAFPPSYDFVRSFHVAGRPYLFASVHDERTIPTSKVELGLAIAKGLLKSDWSGIYEPGKGYGVIWAIASPRSPTIRRITPKAVPHSDRYTNMITFEQRGKAYIVGVHEEEYVNIWRVDDDPTRGFTLEYYGRDP
ncbi:MAG TPA: hypothetical protein VMS64_31370 [Candidatus Methylomirabilis sp.]|nr:hypothetical protein [Candidatus Methylomirabilis sp.]